MKEKVQV